MNNNLFKWVCLGSFLSSLSYGVMLTLPLFLSSVLHLSLVISGEIISMGMIGVILSIVFIPFFLRHFKANHVACIGTLIYSTAIFLTLIPNSVTLYMAGFMLGAGWGIIYTLGPIMVSSTSNIEELSKNFMFISAFNMLGAGLSPTLVKFLIDQKIPIENIFFFSAFFSIIASVIFFNLTIKKDEERKNFPILLGIKEVFTSKLVIPLIMVLLGACIFSSMMNFQFIFAEDRDLNFSVFYVVYTVAILFSRFYLAKWVLKIWQPLAIIGLLILMLTSLSLFLITTTNGFYILPSALLGISYGLVYPLIQTQMVKDAEPEKRSTFLTLFSLSYFIGVFGYPYFFTLGIASGGMIFSFIILIMLCTLAILFALILAKKSRNNILI